MKRKGFEPIVSEVCIPIGEHKTLYSAQRIIIQVRDDAAGLYLAIHGKNDEPEVDETEHEFYLNTVDEIEEFANICKQLIKQTGISTLGDKNGESPT